MIFRLVATGLTVAGVVALGIGPVRVALDRNPAEVGTDAPPPLVLTDDPGAEPRWTTGLVDTSDRTPLRRPARQAKPDRIDLAVAVAAVDDPGTLSVVGTPADETLPGVGVVVAGDEARSLLAVPEPDRTEVLSMIAEPDAAGLSVFAVGAQPKRAVVIDRSSGPGRRDLLVEADEDVAELVAGWAQVRPDLRALVNRGGVRPPEPGLDPAADDSSRAADQPGSRQWRQTVARAVQDEILPALDRGRAPIADDLLFGRDRVLGLEDGSISLTARGAAYAVAARAVQPGSRLLPTRGPEDLEARVLARPDGRVALLAWNPGPARSLVLQVPESDRVLRYELRLAGRALSAVVLRR